MIRTLMRQSPLTPLHNFGPFFCLPFHTHRKSHVLTWMVVRQYWPRQTNDLIQWPKVTHQSAAQVFSCCSWPCAKGVVPFLQCTTTSISTHKAVTKELVGSNMLCGGWVSAWVPNTWPLQYQAIPQAIQFTSQIFVRSGLPFCQQLLRAGNVMTNGFFCISWT